MIKTFKKSNKRETIFITRKSKIVRHGSYDTILSPEFYWVKRVSLPVKNVKAALKLTPSVFDGLLPSGSHFKYLARKDSEDYILIAYDPQKIQAELEEIFLSKSDIRNIYFAQDVLEDIDECTYVNEHIALTKVNGLVIQVPRKCADTTLSIVDKLDNVNLAKKSIKLSSTFASSQESSLKTKELVLIGTVIAFFTVSNFIEHFSYGDKLKALEQKKEQIKESGDLPPTMFQIKSIKKRLSKEFKQQKSIREELYKLSKLRLNDGEYFDEIKVMPKSASVSLHLANEKRGDEIKEKLKEEFKIKDISFDENMLKAKLEI